MGQNGISSLFLIAGIHSTTKNANDANTEFAS